MRHNGEELPSPYFAASDLKRLAEGLDPAEAAIAILARQVEPASVVHVLTHAPEQISELILRAMRNAGGLEARAEEDHYAERVAFYRNREGKSEDVGEIPS